MSREELLALAARVEQATGPCAELDAQIGRFAASEFLGYVPDEPQHGCQKFTASLDAAMSLVPEDLSWEVRRSGGGGGGQAIIWDYQRQPGCVGGRLGGGDIRVRSAATPALALVSASLRARAAEQGEGL